MLPAFNDLYLSLSKSSQAAQIRSSSSSSSFSKSRRPRTRRTRMRMRISGLVGFLPPGKPGGRLEAGLRLPDPALWNFGKAWKLT